MNAAISAQAQKCLELCQALRNTTEFKLLSKLDNRFDLKIPKDGKVRLVVCMPALQSALNDAFGNGYVRIRLAISIERTPMEEVPQLELFEGNGEFLTKYSLTDLPERVAAALEAELVYQCATLEITATC